MPPRGASSEESRGAAAAAGQSRSSSSRPRRSRGERHSTGGPAAESSGDAADDAGRQLPTIEYASSNPVAVSASAVSNSVDVSSEDAEEEGADAAGGGDSDGSSDEREARVSVSPPQGDEEERSGSGKLGGGDAPEDFDWDFAEQYIGVRSIRTELKLVDRTTSGLKSALMQRLKDYYMHFGNHYPTQWMEARRRLLAMAGASHSAAQMALTAPWKQQQQQQQQQSGQRESKSSGESPELAQERGSGDEDMADAPDTASNANAAANAAAGEEKPARRRRRPKSTGDARTTSSRRGGRVSSSAAAASNNSNNNGRNKREKRESSSEFVPPKSKRPSTLESRQQQAAARAATSTQTASGWIDARGRRICGKLNKFGLPCSRVGKICPFHGPIAAADGSEDEQPVHLQRERALNTNTGKSASSRGSSSSFDLESLSTGAGAVLASTSAIPGDSLLSSADGAMSRPSRAASRQARQAISQEEGKKKRKRRGTGVGNPSSESQSQLYGEFGSAPSSSKRQSSRNNVNLTERQEDLLRETELLRSVGVRTPLMDVLDAAKRKQAAAEAATNRTKADQFLFLASLELDRARTEERHHANLEDLMNESRNLVEAIKDNDKEILFLEEVLTQQEEKIAAVEAARVPAMLLHDWKVIESMLTRGPPPQSEVQSVVPLQDHHHSTAAAAALLSQQERSNNDVYQQIYQQAIPPQNYAPVYEMAPDSMMRMPGGYPQHTQMPQQHNSVQHVQMHPMQAAAAAQQVVQQQQTAPAAAVSTQEGGSVAPESDVYSAPSAQQPVLEAQPPVQST
jgi:hypothetical protein